MDLRALQVNIRELGPTCDLLLDPDYLLCIFPSLLVGILGCPKLPVKETKLAQIVVNLEACTLGLDSLVNLIVPKPGLPFPLMTPSLTTNGLSSTVEVAFESLPDFLSQLSLRIHWASLLTFLVKLSHEFCLDGRVPEFPST